MTVKVVLEFTELELSQLHAVLAMVRNDPDWFDDLFTGAQLPALHRAADKIEAALDRVQS